VTRKPASRLRALPAVERLLQSLGDCGLPRPVVVAAVRRELAALRGAERVPEFEVILDRVRQALDRVRMSRLQPVINGTGILIHTNFGRAPLGPAVVAALTEIASSYNNLEYDLLSGERGSRASYLENNLALLCGSEAATVVNNCAAALILILRLFTRTKKEVLISRGELVQIGGGFRIPDILQTSGAVLREVGTTNKTSLSDYTAAIGPDTGLLLKVHQSNFFMGGFVEFPSTEELAALARERNVPFVEDLGSGAIIETERLGAVDHEPTPAEVLRRGVDLVCFSGDKLLGGPQAGIIAGKTALISDLKKEPFFRALRCDKLILAALQATSELYLNCGGQPDRATLSVPILEMMRFSREELNQRAESICKALADHSIPARIGEGEAQIGGGTMPRSILPSATVDLIPGNISLERFAARLRQGAPPIIGYISGGRFKLDLRTIFPAQDKGLVDAILRVLESPPESSRPEKS
jgi:L-seryl-tRNA(Ser) seleniumtransferase